MKESSPEKQESMIKRFRTHWPLLYRRLSLWRCVVAVVVFTVLYNEFLSHFLAKLWWANLRGKGSSPDDNVRMLLVADPQLVGLQDEDERYGAITRWDSDRYMSKTFSYALSHVQPDVVIFLGDLIDEGSKANDMEFQSYMQRFRTVFNTPDHITQVYIPGDNDVGGEGMDFKQERKVKRFNENFLRVSAPESPVVNVKFVDFLTFNWDEGETFDGLTRRKVEKMADNSEAPYKILLNHMSLLSKSRFDFNPILQIAKVNLIFSAHTHMARILTCMDCFEDPKNFDGHFPWKGGVSSIRDNKVYDFRLKDMVTLNEIMVPTCSYRMGVAMMGYGAALLEKDGDLTYTVLWTPPRYTQLYGYMYALVFLLAILASKMALRLFNREKEYGQLPV